jgi:two-component system sensor histidine kinase VicK
MGLSSTIPDADILRQIADRSLAVFFLYDLGTNDFGYVNPAFEEVWGREEAELNEQLPWLLTTVHPDDLLLLKTGFQKLTTDSFRQLLEFRIRTENHQEKWIHLTAYAMLQNGERHSIAGFAEDITHHKENELSANRYSVQKNGILEMLAHDLNGPLGVAQKLAGRMEERAREKGLADIGEVAALINRTISHGIHLIHNLLEKEFLDSSQTALKFQRIELIAQITSMLEGFERMDQDNHKHFELESASPEVFVEVDQTKFMQAIINLVSNAVKFTPPGGHIRIGVQQQSGNLLISVTDDGIGIPKDLQPLIFDRFTKARRPGLRGEVTTGLGLSIVKRIVELHRGKIWVESEENKGAAFFIRIPQQQA